VKRRAPDACPASPHTGVAAQDYQRYRSLAFSGACEPASIASFLRRVFGPAPLLGGPPARSTFGALPLAAAAADLDLSEEVMEAALSYLQEPGERAAAPGEAAGPGAVGPPDEGAYVSVLPSCSAQLTLYFHRSQPAALAAQWPVLAALLASRPRVHRGCYKVRISSCATWWPYAVPCPACELSTRA
jgi:hypothetical protein